MFHGVGVELGVAAGGYSAAILEVADCAVLHSIDRWSDHHDLKEYAVALARLNKHGSRSLVYRATFEEALPLFADASLDFVYIDGYAHTGQDAGRTLRDWWPKLKAGGVFSGHDYDAKYQATVDTVNEFTKANGLPLNLTGEAAMPSWWVVKPCE